MQGLNQSACVVNSHEQTDGQKPLGDHKRVQIFTKIIWMLNPSYILLFVLFFLQYFRTSRGKIEKSQ